MLDTSNRNFGLDILKILSMFMVVVLHTLGKGKVLQTVNPFSVNYYIAQYIDGIFFCAVNVFVITNGFLMYDKRVKAESLLKIVQQTRIYSILITMGVIVLTKSQLNYSLIIRSLLPILTGEYWFVTIYLVILLTTPYTNLALRSMSIRGHKYLTFLLFALFSVWPTFIFFEDPLKLSNGYSIPWFLFLYVLGALLRRIQLPPKKSTYYFVIFLVFGSLIPISRFLIAYATSRYLGNIVGSGFFYRYNSILVLFSGLFLFLSFLNLEVKSSFVKKLILYFSPHSLAVYIIHMNPMLQEKLWVYLKLDDYSNDPLLFVRVAFIVFSIISISVLFDKLRVRFSALVSRTIPFTIVQNQLDKLLNLPFVEEKK